MLLRGLAILDYCIDVIFLNFVSWAVLTSRTSSTSGTPGEAERREHNVCNLQFLKNGCVCVCFHAHARMHVNYVCKYGEILKLVSLSKGCMSCCVDFVTLMCVWGYFRTKFKIVVEVVGRALHPESPLPERLLLTKWPWNIILSKTLMTSQDQKLYNWVLQDSFPLWRAGDRQSSVGVVIKSITCDGNLASVTSF